jgi:hypothetical protein
MELLSEFTSWTGYAGYQVAVAVIDVRMSARKLQAVTDKYTVQKKAKTVSETKALVALEPEVQEMDYALIFSESFADQIKAIYNHLESCMKTVSRELTRRTSRSTVEERNGKYNT